MVGLLGSSESTPRLERAHVQCRVRGLCATGWQLTCVAGNDCTSSADCAAGEQCRGIDSDDQYHGQCLKGLEESPVGGESPVWRAWC